MAIGVDLKGSLLKVRNSTWPQRLLCVLRAAPWLVFGPITGMMSERAVACFRKREPILGGLYVVLNIVILLAIPAVTAALARGL